MTDAERDCHAQFERRMLYAILGSLGFIGATMVGIGGWVGSTSTLVENAGAQRAELKNQISDLKTQVATIESRVSSADATAAALNQRLSSIEQEQRRQAARIERVIDILTDQNRRDSRGDGEPR